MKRDIKNARKCTGRSWDGPSLLCQTGFFRGMHDGSYHQPLKSSASSSAPPGHADDVGRLKTRAASGRGWQPPSNLHEKVRRDASIRTHVSVCFSKRDDLIHERRLSCCDGHGDSFAALLESHRLLDCCLKMPLRCCKEPTLAFRVLFRQAFHAFALPLLISSIMIFPFALSVESCLQQQQQDGQ